MRITSGKARGISLKSPKGDTTRPATDAARQAIFSSLGGAVADAVVYDVFAGTGSYGLEAISRGAASVVFFESDRKALEVLRENIASMKKAIGGIEAGVISGNVLALKAASFDTIPDLIFADPPYELLRNNSAEIFCLLAKMSGPDTMAIIEAPADFEPEGVPFEIVKRLGKKSKGKPSQILMRLKEASK